MKPSIQKTILPIALMLGCLLGASTPYAQFITSTFSRPMPYCFPQSDWQRRSGVSTFNYHQIIGLPENQFMNGDVFVTLRLKNKPNVFWLYEDGGKWTKYLSNDAGKIPAAYYTGEMQPVKKLSITLPTKKKLPALGTNNWELYVGYGLRSSESATIQDSFENMISNNRNYLVWDAGFQNDINTMCLLTSEVSLSTLDVMSNPIGF